MDTDPHGSGTIGQIRIQARDDGFLHFCCKINENITYKELHTINE